MYTLYWSPGSANMTPHAMLEDIGVRYELVKVDTSKGEQRHPDYLKVNPHGRVPALLYDGGKVLYEATAISMFLAERHPDAGFAPETASEDRPQFLQWMAHLTNTPQEALGHWWRPEKLSDSADHRAGLKQKAEHRLGAMFAFIDGHLAKSGPWLCGANFYACDYYVAMLAQWTDGMATPAYTNPSLNKLLRAVVARRGYARMLVAEGITQSV